MPSFLNHPFGRRALSVTLTGRRLLACAVAVLGGWLMTAESLSAERPAFVATYTVDLRPLEVLAVEALSLADIVVLNGGYEDGYRAGMVCQVFRFGRPVGELLVVSVRPRHSAATIQSLTENMTIQPGDTVRPRIASSF